MRTLLFRGKSLETDIWVYGGILIQLKRSFIIDIESNLKEVNPDSVGQFTGNLDINKNNVFEGDVVESKTPYGNLEKEIVWDKERCGFYMKSSFVAYDSKNLYSISKKRMKVIGNTFDNPELTQKVLQ